jgi:hypothetical protein
MCGSRKWLGCLSHKQSISTCYESVLRFRVDCRQTGSNPSRQQSSQLAINRGYTYCFPCLVQLTDAATTPVKYGHPTRIPEESTLPKMPRKAKKSADRHIERSTSFRLGPSVLKAADVIAREESAARGIKVSRADIIREAVMERYRRRKVKRKG